MSSIRRRKIGKFHPRAIALLVGAAGLTSCHKQAARPQDDAGLAAVDRAAGLSKETAGAALKAKFAAGRGKLYCSLAPSVETTPGEPIWPASPFHHAFGRLLVRGSDHDKCIDELHAAAVINAGRWCDGTAEDSCFERGFELGPSADVARGDLRFVCGKREYEDIRSLEPEGNRARVTYTELDTYDPWTAQVPHCELTGPQPGKREVVRDFHADAAGHWSLPDDFWYDAAAPMADGDVKAAYDHVLAAVTAPRTGGAGGPSANTAPSREPPRGNPEYFYSEKLNGGGGDHVALVRLVDGKLAVAQATSVSKRDCPHVLAYTHNDESHALLCEGRGKLTAFVGKALDDLRGRSVPMKSEVGNSFRIFSNATWCVVTSNYGYAAFGLPFFDGEVHVNKWKFSAPPSGLHVDLLAPYLVAGTSEGQLEIATLTDMRAYLEMVPTDPYNVLTKIGISRVSAMAQYPAKIDADTSVFGISAAEGSAFWALTSQRGANLSSFGAYSVQYFKSGFLGKDDSKKLNDVGMTGPLAAFWSVGERALAIGSRGEVWLLSSEPPQMLGQYPDYEAKKESDRGADMQFRNLGDGFVAFAPHLVGEAIGIVDTKKPSLAVVSESGARGAPRRSN